MCEKLLSHLHLKTVNTFSRNYFFYKLPEPAGAETADYMYAHNHFLQMAGEIGIIGLAVFLWLLFNLFRFAKRLYKTTKDDYCKILTLSVSACLVAFLINGFTETSLYYSRVAMIFWYWTGLLLALGRISDLEAPVKQ